MRSYLSILIMMALIAGCAATGHNFDASRLSSLTPGRTTLEEASRALNAPPDKFYQQTDGTLLALWSYKITYVTDALYRRKEALLQFDAAGRLIRLVDSTHILLKAWERQKLLGPAVSVSDAAQRPAPVFPQEENIAIPVPATPPEPMSQGQ